MAEARYDCESIEADRYFDMPGYIERRDIEAKLRRRWRATITAKSSGRRRSPVRHSSP